MAGTSRAAMVQTAARLFRHHGYDATSWRRITAESGAPSGSIGYLFPRGKEQLAEEVVADVSAVTCGQIATLLDGGAAPAEMLRRWITASARALEASDFLDGCPLATLTLELAHRSPGVQERLAEGYDSWSALLVERLTPTHGDAATDTAEIVLAAFEGALLLSRARRSTQPLDLLAARAEQLVDVLRSGDDGDGERPLTDTETSDR